MTKRKPRFWLLTYQFLAGLSDTSTGCLLLLAPQWALTLMGVHHPPQPIEFASFVGAFVLGVGLTYLLSMRFPMNAANTLRWQTVWAVTALIRSLVAIFLLTAIFSGRMELAWLTVALLDGTLAVIQWIGLTKGWLDFAG